MKSRFCSPCESDNAFTGAQVRDDSGNETRRRIARPVREEQTRPCCLHPVLARCRLRRLPQCQFAFSIQGSWL